MKNLPTLEEFLKSDDYLVESFGLRWKEIDSKDKVVIKEKDFKTEKDRQNFIDKLEKNSNFVSIESYANESLKEGEEIDFKVESAIQGLTNQQARNFIFKIADKSYYRGLYKDDFWKGKDDILNALQKANIYYEMTNSEYSPEFPNTWKKWYLQFPFTNKANRETVLYGTITASGGGSVDYPLDRYDITFTL